MSIMSSRWMANVAVALLYPFTRTVVHGCGGFFCEPNNPIVQAGEAIAFGVQGNVLEMHVQILYSGPAEKFSWLLPVPFEPTVDVGSDILFQRLFQQTLPQFSFTVQEPESDLPCLGEDTCAPVAFDSGGVSGEEDRASAEAEVLQEGSVGPFDFVVLQAGEGNPDSIRKWLQDNNYDEYQGSAALLNYYARLDHKFVALRLQKEADTGDIQPIILTQTMPEADDPLTMAIACIPIKLTAVAANDDMPIHAYILGDSRAEPINWFEVILDDKQVNWLGCQNSQSCYYNDLRSRFTAATQTVQQQTFLTEYAGDSSIMASQIEIDIDLAALSSSATPLIFLQAMAQAGVPSLTLVDTIVDTFIPSANVPDDTFCQSLPSLYTPNQLWLFDTCAANLKLDSFDATGLAQTLNEKVFIPAADAQAFVDRHSYMTKMYAEQSPSNMLRDPFFRFSGELNDVPLLHSAVGVVSCESAKEAIMEITVDDGTSVSIPVSRQCGSWFPINPQPLFGSVPDGISPALHFVVSEFGGSPASTIERGVDYLFDQTEIWESFAELDSRVVNQTVPEFNGTILPSFPQGPSSWAARSTGGLLMLSMCFAMAVVTI